MANIAKPVLLGMLAEKTKLSKNQVDEVFDALIEVIQGEVLGKGESLPIPGLGKFDRKIRSARIGRNPKDGTAVQIPEKTSVVFKAASAMKK